MKNGRIDIGSIRRGQIVEAAAAVIAEQGLDKLSLSAIEAKAGMSRGQLTYYFPTKEDILLAVFDRVVAMMRQRIGSEPCPQLPAGGWEMARFLLQHMVTDPPVNSEFTALQYAFLAQMRSRDDFRQRLARQYEEWRTHLSEELEADPPRRKGRRFSSRTIASLVQAILHGVIVQCAVDPQAFDRQEMLALCLHLLGDFLSRSARKTKRRRNRRVASTLRNGKSHEQR